MNQLPWEAIESICFLIFAGSAALSAYTLYRVTRELLAAITEIVNILGQVRPSGNRTNNTGTAAVERGATDSGQAAERE
jgi:hypothetical protein